VVFAVVVFMMMFFIGGGFCFGVLRGAVFCGGIIYNGGCYGRWFFLVAMVIVNIMAFAADRIVGMEGIY